MNNKEILRKERGFLRDALSKFEGKELEDEILFLFEGSLTQARKSERRRFIEQARFVIESYADKQKDTQNAREIRELIAKVEALSDFIIFLD